MSARVCVVGGGFAGLTAAYELARRGIAVTVLEADAELGGLAGQFEVGGQSVERFYHHWFTNDRDALDLVEELGLGARLEINPTHTGIYFANDFFKLSTPWDLLNFTPLPFADRIRLGVLALRARRVRNWTELESKTAAQWLRELGGESVYKVVWEPLLRGKFGPYADQVSAVWFWNKLKLRGASRGSKGEERLAYLRGGFAQLTQALADDIRRRGGQVLLNSQVHTLEPQGDLWNIRHASGDLVARRVIATPSLPLIAQMIEGWASPDYLNQLRRIDYLANVCLVLELDRPLSNTYWLNVNDPSFPFVGVIEHTNFESPGAYNGRHIVYLSKYLPHTDALFAMNAREALEFAMPHLTRMFPLLQPAWVLNAHLWRARWSQPVVERQYGSLIPAADAPYPGLHLCSMAQIYPEDRGTSYAIREGRRIGRRIGALEKQRVSLELRPA